MFALETVPDTDPSTNWGRLVIIFAVLAAVIVLLYMLVKRLLER